MFNYLFLANKPEIASYAERCGVTRIFIDLETIGKLDRQGHLDTVISRHSFNDIQPIKSVLKTAKLMVRINPLHANTKKEIDKVVSLGADIIMLPMFRSLADVQIVGDMINSRAMFIPLVETQNAALEIDKIHDLNSVDEIHIGLNDLHLDMNMDFMFQLLSEGFVEKLVSNLTKPFGIGGIARLGGGIIPAEYVLAEHVRLGSSAVILSRAFHLRSESLDDLRSRINLREEISKLNEYLVLLRSKTESELMETHNQFTILVDDYLRSINEANM